MQPELQPRGARQRLVRATGAAVGVGVALMENCVPGTGGRLMVFTGGPCTTGPGMVVGLALEDSIRTHRVCSACFACLQQDCTQLKLVHLASCQSSCHDWGILKVINTTP